MSNIRNLVVPARSGDRSVEVDEKAIEKILGYRISTSGGAWPLFLRFRSQLGTRGGHFFIPHRFGVQMRSIMMASGAGWRVSALSICTGCGFPMLCVVSSSRSELLVDPNAFGGRTIFMSGFGAMNRMEIGSAEVGGPIKRWALRDPGGAKVLLEGADGDNLRNAAIGLCGGCQAARHLGPSSSREEAMYRAIMQMEYEAEVCFSIVSPKGMYVDELNSRSL